MDDHENHSKGSSVHHKQTKKRKGGSVMSGKGSCKVHSTFRPVVFTEEKAERVIPVIEQIISRHFGRELKITDYKITDHEISRSS